SILVAGIRPARRSPIEHGAVLEENSRVITAQCRTQQPHRVLCVGGHGDSPAHTVYPGDLVGLTVPGIAAFEEAARHADHQRGGEAVVGAPTQRSAIVELLGRGISVLAKLDLGHRQEPGEGHAHGAADDALFRQARVEYPGGAVFLLQPECRAVDSALAAHVLAEYDHARVAGQLDLQRATNGRLHVDLGGLASEGYRHAPTSATPSPEAAR